MSLIISFSIFIMSVITCILTGCTLVIALIVGLGAFFICALHRGYDFKSVVGMCRSGLSKGLIVVNVLIIIGFMTGVWRTSGTIAVCVYYGIKLINSGSFLIITFLLCSVLSYAVGTSFGIAATVGVIFMALARAGNVNELITAGVIMSGIYFGDRGSPASSSAILVAALTGTNHLRNVKIMAKYAAIPFVIVLVIYSAFSYMNPIHQVDRSFMNGLQSQFNISWWCLVPAICMLILPFIRVKVTNAMLVSIASGIVISIVVEGVTWKTLLYTLLMGYKSNTYVGAVFNGGGFISMLEVIFIVGISSAFSGIFDGTQMLAVLQDKIDIMAGKIGNFPSMVIVGLALTGIFCNQTLPTIMGNDMMKRTYKNSGASNYEIASDIQNSIIVLAGVVPWSIACTVPLAMMGVGYGAMPFACFMYLLPIIYGIEKLTKWKFYDRTQ